MQHFSDALPRPAVPDGRKRLRDVFGDTFTLGEEVQRGAFGVFKVGTQMARPEPRLLAIKDIDLKRNPAFGGPTLADVRRECSAMPQAGSALSPYAVRYTYSLRRPLRPSIPPVPPYADKALFKPESVAMFMPLAAGGDVLGRTNTFIDHAPLMLGLFARHVLACVATQLEAMHAGGVVHGDVKIENLFVGCDGTAHLGDFGQATRRGIRDGRGMGSFAFAAPEQVEGAYGERADVYSLAVCIVTILGTNPLDFDTAPDLAHMISFAHHRRALLAQWIEIERTGGPLPSISPDDELHWEQVRFSMALAKASEPRLMPLLMTMLAHDAAARPSAQEVGEMLRRQNLHMTREERSDLLRTMLTLPEERTRRVALKAARAAASNLHACGCGQ